MSNIANRYDRFGASHNKTLINQFVTSSCWSLIFSNILTLIPEILLTLFGPSNKYFCFIHTILKNTIFIQFVVNLTAISIVRYIYIFVKKNPSGRNDDFICFFVNLAAFVNTTTWQVVHQLTNGYNHHPYYLCCGALPDPTMKDKMNYSLTFVTIFSPTVFIYVLVKIKIYKNKEATVNLTAYNKPVTSSLGLLHQASIADFVTVAIGMFIVIPTTVFVLYLVIDL
jgi:hypothetical protein